MQRGQFGGRSKASASTTCQKCLKKDMFTPTLFLASLTDFPCHYSYECTVSAQERPYKSRPSRTQQLLNPKLKPKLTTEVPNDLLRKKGVADEILAKKEEERGRRSSRDGGKSSRKRSRSVSSDSVSTISTNRSPSRSPSPKRRERSKISPTRGGDSFKKRGRAESSDSVSSSQSYDRNMRRRLSSFSPQERGRRSRSHSDRMEMSQDMDTILRTGRKRFSRSRSSDRGRGRGRGRGRRASRSRSGDRYGKRPVRQISLSRSPSRNPDRMDMSEERQPRRQNGVDKGELAGTRRASSSRSRSRSRVRGHISRSSRSPYNGYRGQSPSTRREPPRSPSPFRPRNGNPYRNGPAGGRARQFEGRRPEQEPNPGSRPPQRERSLSPYSKRLAMTRQMHTGR